MSLNNFYDKPWQTSHTAYDTSPFNIRPAPEFSTAEVMVASLYRTVGYPSYSETEVPKSGREFDRISQAVSKSNVMGQIGTDTWRTILHSVLESPKQPNQSSKRFLQLCPVVPDTALYSGSARLAGNSWNPGALVARMILLGAATRNDAQRIWDRLFNALSVGEDDDVWARWLHTEFARRRKINQQWDQADLPNLDGFPESDKALLRYPAKQFVKDLDAVIIAKESMTRRQWVSLLEALLRIAAVTHVIWLCRVSDRLWRAVGAILGQGDASIPNNEEEVRAQVLSGEGDYLSYGNPAMPSIKDFASRYLVGRLGLNLILWNLDKIGVPIKKLGSAVELLSFIDAVRLHKDRLKSENILDALHSLYDDEVKTIGCKKGIGSNLIEFSRHTLGQRQTTNDGLRGYDQSYFLRKRGDKQRAPWVLSLGPVAVLAMAHCCLREVNGPRSVKRLSDHLAWYGIQVDLDDINASDLGKKLRMLGLVLDSPDAESGMLLTPPFGIAKQKVET